MAATDAKAIPVKAAAYRVTFPILDADGDLVTGAASLDSEVSKDGGTFADCTNEATEIATSSGVYYLDLTSTEMDADTVAIIVKTGTAGAKTTVLVLYPAARNINDLAYPTTSGRSIDVTTGGAVGVDWGNVENATTTVGLSGTTIKTATDVEADTQDLQARVPATLTAGGNLKADVEEWKGATAPAMTGDAFARLGAPAGASVSADVAAVKSQTAAIETDTQDIQSRLPAALTGAGNIKADALLLNGATPNNLSAAQVNAEADTALADYDAPTRAELTSDITTVLTKLLKYVQLLARKDAAIATDNATELTAINADGGSGAGAFANATDGLEALRDRGDAAWITATGFSTLSAADIRTAVGLASANLDTQLGVIATDTTTDIPALIAALNDLSAAEVRTALGLASADLDSQLAALPTAVENADTLLGRNIAGGSSTGRTVTSALRVIRNRRAVSGGTLTVYQEDDSTPDHTAAVTTTAGDPISEVDPS